jgi:serine/threonine protein kinase
MAPELLGYDPNEESTSGRPTKQSDVYALGMVVWQERLLYFVTHRLHAKLWHFQMFTLKKSFYERRSEFAVLNVILRGDRPQKPSGTVPSGFSDLLWKVLKSCWSANPMARPAVEDLLALLPPYEDRQPTGTVQPHLPQETAVEPTEEVAVDANIRKTEGQVPTVNDQFIIDSGEQPSGVEYTVSAEHKIKTPDNQRGDETLVGQQAKERQHVDLMATPGESNKMRSGAVAFLTLD